MLTIDLDVTYIVVLALFVLPVILLNGLLFGPFLRLFAARYERLEGALAKTAAMLAEAERQAEEFAGKIRIATEQGIEARNHIRREAALEMNARIEAERTKMVSRLERSLEQLKKTRRQSLADVHVNAVKLAEFAAVKILGRSL